MKARAPVTGGNFGVWGGMFSTFDCAVKGFRQKEDAWNAIISGFMTGGCLAARSEWPFTPATMLYTNLHGYQLIMHTVLQVVQDLPLALRLLAVSYSVCSRVLGCYCLGSSAKDNGLRWHRVSSLSSDSAFLCLKCSFFTSTTRHDTTTSHTLLDSWIAIDAYTYYISLHLYYWPPIHGLITTST
jgi:hypothetical protein